MTAVRTRHLRPTDLRGKRYRAYLRESTQSQADRGTPLDRQRADILRAADELCLIPAEPVWYERVGSGEIEGTPELAVALTDARAGTYDVLLVFHSSRLGRNRLEVGLAKRDFAKAGVVIYITSQRLICGTFAGALSEGVAEVIDEYGNEERRMWIAGGHRERMLAGKWLGAIPVGYRKKIVDHPDGTRGWDGGLEPDPTTAPIVRSIFDRFLAGTETRDAAYQLNAEGSRSLRAPWARSQVTKVLRNPVYAGLMVRYREHREKHYYPEDDERDGRWEAPGSWEPLVPAEVFGAVQKLLDERVPVQSHRRGRRRYPLSAVMRCAKCGHRFSGVQGGNGRRYYRCSKRAAEGTCDAPSVRAEEAEAIFARWLAAIRLPPDWRAEIARLEEPVRDDSGRARLEERLHRLRDLYSWGDMDEPSYRAEVQGTQQQIAALTRPAPASIETVARGLTRIGDHWLTAAPDQQARLAVSMLRAVIAQDGRLAALVVRPEIRPLLDFSVVDDRRVLASIVNYSFG